MVLKEMKYENILLQVMKKMIDIILQLIIIVKKFGKEINQKF